MQLSTRTKKAEQSAYGLQMSTITKSWYHKRHFLMTDLTNEDTRNNEIVS